MMMMELEFRFTNRLMLKCNCSLWGEKCSAVIRFDKTLDAWTCREQTTFAFSLCSLFIFVFFLGTEQIFREKSKRIYSEWRKKGIDRSRSARELIKKKKGEAIQSYPAWLPHLITESNSCQYVSFISNKRFAYFILKGKKGQKSPMEAKSKGFQPI